MEDGGAAIICWAGDEVDDVEQILLTLRNVRAGV